MVDETIGTKLLRLKERSGLTLTNIAKAAGYRSASSIQRYFSSEYDAEYLPSQVARRLAEGLTGFGEPTIQSIDIELLTEHGFLISRRYPEPVQIERAHRTYIECASTFPWGWIEGAEVFHIGDDPTIYFRKPDHLNQRAICAIYVSTTSIAPRYIPGDVLFYELERPAAIGADAIVLLKETSEKSAGALLGRLLARTKDGLAFAISEQDQPLVLPHSEIDDILPVLRAQDLLQPLSRDQAYASG